MKKINLRELYPDVYTTDFFVDVTEEVMETIRAAERAETAYERNYQLQKSEAFQSVHHVTFILCYTVLYNFFGLRCHFGRHRAEVYWTSCALVFSLIRVRKHWWNDITQGKQ